MNLLDKLKDDTIHLPLEYSTQAGAKKIIDIVQKWEDTRAQTDEIS